MAPTYYTGGYSEVTVKKMEAVNLPLKICCLACKKWKVMEQYSKRQLSDLRYKIIIHGRAPELLKPCIKCRTCTGVQVTELTCILCDCVKGLAEFSLAQRRTPDSARCIRCMEKVLLTEPDIDEEWNSDDESEPSNYYETASQMDTISQADTESEGGAQLPSSKARGLSDTFAQMRLAQTSVDDSMYNAGYYNPDHVNYIQPAGTRATHASQTSSQPASANARTAAWVHYADSHDTSKAKGKGKAPATSSDSQDTFSEIGNGNVWTKQVGRVRDEEQSDVGSGVWTRQVRKENTVKYTAYDPQGHAHTRIRAPSTAASSEYNDRSISPAPGRYSTSGKMTGGFAKPSKVVNKFIPSELPPHVENGFMIDLESDGDSDAEI